MIKFSIFQSNVKFKLKDDSCGKDKLSFFRNVNRCYDMGGTRAFITVRQNMGFKWKKDFYVIGLGFRFMVFNASFNNISIIS